MSTVQSIERAFRILDVIAASEEGVSVTETSKQVALPTSTVSRLIITLEQLGAVERLENERVKIGKRILSMGASLPFEQNLTTLARPHLQDIASSIGEDAALVTPDGFDAHFIDQVSGGQVIQVQDWTGSKFPMHSLTAGKLFLAYASKETLERYLSKAKSETFSVSSFKKQLKQTKQDAYAWSFGEFSQGLNAVSVPLFIEGLVVAALTVYGPAFRFPLKKQKTVTDLLIAKSQQLSKQLSSLTNHATTQ